MRTFRGPETRARTRPRQVAAVLVCLVSLAGCEKVGDQVSNFYDSKLPLDQPEDWWHQLQGGMIAEQRPPPPGAADPYPNLDQVPPRPTPTDAATQAQAAGRAGRPARQRQAGGGAAADRLAGPRRPNPAPANPVAASRGPSDARRRARRGNPEARRQPGPSGDAQPGARARRHWRHERVARRRRCPAAAGRPARRAAAGSLAPARVHRAAAAPAPRPRRCRTRPSRRCPPPHRRCRRCPASRPRPPSRRRPARCPLPGSSSPAAPPLLPPTADAALRQLASLRAGATIRVSAGGDAASASPDAQAAALPLALRRVGAITATLIAAGVPPAALRADAAALGRDGTARLVD